MGNNYVKKWLKLYVIMVFFFKHLLLFRYIMMLDIYTYKYNNKNNNNNIHIIINIIIQIIQI